MTRISLSSLCRETRSVVDRPLPRRYHAALSGTPASRAGHGRPGRRWRSGMTVTLWWRCVRTVRPLTAARATC